MSFNLQLSKSENIKAMFSAPKWLSLCNQFRLSIAKWWIIRSQQLSQLLDNDTERNDSTLIFKHQLEVLNVL